MKKHYLLSWAVLLMAAFMFSCEDDGPDEPDINKTYDYSEILADYVDNTIIPTYGDMKDNAKMLLSKTQDFESSSAQADIDAACEYWKKTRKPWEASEAFLFGPAAFNNLDPLLDSWPLDRAQLDQVLTGNQELTADFVRNGLGAVLRGFHTVEYLLFRDGEPRNVADVTQREKEYLTAVTEVLRDDCIKLWALWDGGSSEQAILEALEIEVPTPYGEEFKKAGQVGSRYLSQTDAVDEMLQGMMAIADEVANAKIADPHNSNNVLDVESWFSWNSLTDFQNNIKSIENSYLGGYNQNERGKSISDYVKAEDVAIDTEVKQKIAAAITAIAAIPQPFRNNLSDEKVQPSMDAVNELLDVIGTKVRPLIVN